MKFLAIRPIALVLSRELAITLLLLLGVSFVVFLILYLSPGDPFSVLLEGQLSTAEARAGLREAMGVPKSWFAQYLSWLAGMLQGNFGTSIRTGLPVLKEVFRVGLNTLVSRQSSPNRRSVRHQYPSGAPGWPRSQYRADTEGRRTACRTGVRRE